jgi:hypothetical protein
MTEVQGRGTGALNIERIYSTTVPAEELPGRWRTTSVRRSLRHRFTAPAGTAR